MASREREICRMHGCINLQGLKSRNAKGDKVWRTLCEKHHKGNRSGRIVTDGICSLCGWLGRVHRHRKLPEIGYRDLENLVILCPNCHEAEHNRGESNLDFFYRINQNSSKCQ